MRRNRNRCESLSTDPSQPLYNAAASEDLVTPDDYYMMDMSDTLFSSLNPPAFNTPRDLCESLLRGRLIPLKTDRTLGLFPFVTGP